MTPLEQRQRIADAIVPKEKPATRKAVQATAPAVSYNSSDYQPAAIETLTPTEKDRVYFLTTCQGWDKDSALRDIAMRRAIAKASGSRTGR